MRFDIAVAWRIYPLVSKTPLIHSEDKFELVKTCLYSFVQATRNLSVKYYIILDGCPPTYEKLIKELLMNKTHTIIKTDKIGNLATFKLQVELLTNETEADVVYFAEDDYLYKPGEVDKMVNLIKHQKDVDFVSCYFHKDTIDHPIHDHSRKIKFSEEQLWITDSSTCMTFMTKKSTLLKTKDLLLTYSKGNNDCAMWLVLTKTHILNPLSYIKLFRHTESFNILKMAVKYSFSYFFSGRSYKLWIPYPGIGVHLEKDFIIDPTNWLKLTESLETTLKEKSNV